MHVPIEIHQFQPWLRPTLWGGGNLRRYGKTVPEATPIGESWEVSGHPLHISQTANGHLLTDLWQSHASDWTAGTHAGNEAFPLLVKLLDCRLPCSVQVHPEESAGSAPHHLPKTEAWTVLEASANARVYSGLRTGVTQDEVQSALACGDVFDCLHDVEPRVGDCFLITPGTVHTMQGVVLAEFQTTSDATLRLFDWNRNDLDGQPREIHIEESLAAIDWNRGPVGPVTPRPLSTSSDAVKSELLVDIAEFRLIRHTFTGGWTTAASDIFSIWMLTYGDAIVTAPAVPKHLRAGDTLLIPPHGGLQFVASGESVLLHCAIRR